MKVLVAGCGSVGLRHLRNLAEHIGGHELLAADPDPERCRAAAEEAGAEAFPTLEEALAAGPDAVVVATPTHLHKRAMEEALSADCHIFVEKPIAAASEGVEPLLEEARRRSLVVMVGYNLRFHPGVRSLRQVIQSGRIGRVCWARAEYGWYLPDWRPGRNYLETYSARRAEGGGVLLDVSHEVDLLRYLLGEAQEVSCLTRNTGTLGTDVEEIASLTIGFAGGAIGEAHLDYLQRAYCRECKVVGTEGTAVWKFTAERLSVFRADAEAWEVSGWEEFDPAQAYVDEMREFLAAARDLRDPRPDGWEGLRTLKLVEAAARSAAAGRRLEVPRD